MRLIFSLPFKVSRFNIFVCTILLVLTGANKAAGQVISFVSPTSGNVGSDINIYGNNFDPLPANNIVYFGAVKATVLTASASQLTLKTPAGSFYKPVSVTVAGNTVFHGYPFVTTFLNTTYGLQPAFSPKVDVPAGSGPAAMLLGDLDGDGKPDMVVANAAGNNLTIYPNASNNSTIQFGTGITMPAAGGPNHVVIADMDGDGKLDLVVVNASVNTVSVYRNASSGTGISFAQPIAFSTGNTPFQATVADFDNDKKPDIAVVNRSSDNSFSVLRNTGSIGTISFAPKVDFATGNFPIAIAAGVFKANSGKTDIAVVNYQSSTVSVFKNNSAAAGSISFDPKIDIATGSFPISVALGDFVNDGYLDIAVANFGDNTVSVIAGNYTSDPTFIFSAKQDFATGTGPSSIALNDINGDGLADMIVSNQSANTVSVIRNTVIGQTLAFAAKSDYVSAAFPSFVTTADMDADGRAELFTVNTTGQSVSMFKNSSGDGVPVINNITPATAATGETVTIHGKNFTGLTGIRFGGTNAASYTLISDTAIAAVIGVGASGSVTVNTTLGFGKLPGFVYKYAAPFRVINTVAGSDTAGFSGDNGNGLNARFNFCSNVSADTANKYIYINDAQFNTRIRKYDCTTGIVTTVAGNGYGSLLGNEGIPATTAIIAVKSLNELAVNKNGLLFFSEYNADKIRKVDQAGLLRTVVGGGNSTNEFTPPLQYRLFGPNALAIDRNENLYEVSANDSYSSIKKIDALANNVITFAGTGVSGFNGDSVNALSAQFVRINSLAVDGQGNVFVADGSGFRIRKIDAVTRQVITVAGNGESGGDGEGGLAVNAQIGEVSSIALDTMGNLYLAGNCVYKVDAVTKIITRIAGNKLSGSGGEGGNALLAPVIPRGITVDNRGDIYVTNTNKLMRISLFNPEIIVCPGAPVDIPADVIGTSFQWQFSTDSINFISIFPNDFAYSGATTANLHLNAANSIFYGWQYRCLINGQPGRVSTLKFQDTWTGAVNSSWENPANWSCNALPDRNTDVIINNGNVVVSSNGICRSLTVKPGATVTVTPGFNLTVTH